MENRNFKAGTHITIQVISQRLETILSEDDYVCMKDEQGDLYVMNKGFKLRIKDIASNNKVFKT
jgi:hypothetical protein